MPHNHFVHCTVLCTTCARQANIYTYTYIVKQFNVLMLQICGNKHTLLLYNPQRGSIDVDIILFGMVSIQQRLDEQLLHF